jgi:hypothetical protein
MTKRVVDHTAWHLEVIVGVTKVLLDLGGHDLAPRGRHGFREKPIEHIVVEEEHFFGS